MIKSLSIAAILALSAGAVMPAAASAQHYDPRYDHGRSSSHDYDRDRDRDSRRHDSRDYRDTRKCSDGTTGTVVGAIAGGLLGRTIDTRGDRTVGTLGGAVLGGLAGRSVDRSGNSGYCRR